MSKILQGFQWTMSLKGVEVGAGFGRTVILMALLGPRSFGLLALAFVFINILENLTASGIGEAIIFDKGDPYKYYNLGFTIRIIRQNLVGAVTWLAAPVYAWFFKDSQLGSLMQVLAFAYMAAGFENVANFHFKKMLQFRKSALFNHASFWAETLGAVAGVYLAGNVVGYGYGVIAGKVVRVVLSYVIFPFRPRFAWDREGFLRLLGFGKWVTGYTVVGFLLENVETLLLGKILGVTDLGVLNSARSIALRPARTLAIMGKEVLFPVYSRNTKQGIDARHMPIARAFLLAGPLLAFAYFYLAAPAVAAFLKPEWRPLIPALRVYAPVALMSTFTQFITFSYLNGIGRPDLNFRTGVVNLAVGVPFVLGMGWTRGLDGVLMAELGRHGLLFAVSLLQLVRTGFVSWRKMAGFLKGPLLMALLWGGVSIVARRFPVPTGVLPAAVTIFYLLFTWKEGKRLAVSLKKAAKGARRPVRNGIGKDYPEEVSRNG
jgi:O-antigen/teichoic acid export membrane protein